jgi:cyclopropane fatty-acyl-phospholipid synthase-like methyltransferase
VREQMSRIVNLLLSFPRIYSNITLVLRGEKNIQYFVDTYVKPGPNDKLLDIGCGPADILDFLPGVEYYGFDQDKSYIDAAKKRFGNRGRFYCRAVSLDSFSGEHTFDIILAMGILHHLDDDEAQQLFELSYNLLKPGGRLITYDGCYTENQSIITKFILAIDRGKYIRKEPAYKKLAEKYFSNNSIHIRNDLLQIPYTIIIIECKK